MCNKTEKNTNITKSSLDRNFEFMLNAFNELLLPRESTILEVKGCKVLRRTCRSEELRQNIKVWSCAQYE